MPGNESYSGQVVGNYLIQEKLGSGEFGSVYRAQNKLIAERVVAIKLINAKYVSSPEECAHFLDEARVLLRLQHPYILPVFDIGEHNATPYIVIEFAPTGSLRSVLEHQANRRLPTDKALTVLSQVGQALYFAHQQRVVHRDLKPDNILFNTKNDAMLADFGIAVEVATSTNRNAAITGTPPYMAPEQFQGIASIHSDQYALGCIAYELLTGSRPFQASTFTAWAIKHSQETPIPPRQLNPAIPTYVEQAILRAMAKERTQRFPDVSAFVAALSPQGVYPTTTARTVLRSPAGQTVLGTLDVTIGRAPDNTYVINDSQVSGHHAIIRQADQGYVIIDLKSTNKTFVNARAIAAETPHPLHQGDSIRVGATTFEYANDASVSPTVGVVPPTIAAAAVPPPPPRAAPTVAVAPLPLPIRPSGQTPQPIYNQSPVYPYTPPLVPQQPQQPPSQKRHLTGLWITLIIIGALVLSCGLLGIVGYIYNQNQATGTPKALDLSTTYTGMITDNQSHSTSLNLKFESEVQSTGDIQVALLIPCSVIAFCTASQGSLLSGTVNHQGEVKFTMPLTNGTLISFDATVNSDNTSITHGTYTGSDGEQGTWSAQ